MKGFQHFLQRLLEVVLFLILLTPLLVWHGFLFPHLTAKVIVFQVLVEIASAVALTLILLQIRRPAPARKWHLTPPWLLTIGVAIYLIYSLVNSIFGIDFRRSLWGFVDRQDGLVLWLHFFAWFAVVVWFYSAPQTRFSPEPHGHSVKDRTHTPVLKERGIFSYVRFSFWVSFTVALTALMEWISVNYLDSVPSILQTPFPDRPSGALGNPMALGPYLLVHLFLGVYYLLAVARPEMISLAAASKIQRHSPAKPGWRPSLIFILVLTAELVLLMVIVMGKTRGVIFGLLLSLFTVAVCFLFRKDGSRRLKIAAVAVCLLVIATGLTLWKFRETEAVKNVPLLERLTRISVAENESTRMRVMVWRSTARGFWDHPLLGWGHNNVYYALNRYYDPRHASFQPDFSESRATWYDKSHNALLDILVEKGAAGAFLFLAVMIAVVLNLARMKDKVLSLCLTGALTAYAFSDLVAFDSFGSMFGLYLSLALLVLSARPGEVPSLESKKKVNARSGEMSFARQVGIVTVSIALVFGLYLNKEIAVANARSLEANSVFDQLPADGETLYLEAFSHRSPYLPREKLNYCYRVVNSLINKRPLRTNSLNQALQAANEAVEAHPSDVAGYMIMNDVCNGLGLHIDKRYLDQAEAAGRKALELSPARQEVIFFLGRTYILRNEPRRAVELNETMVRSYPDFALGHWFLGLSLIADNVQERARSEIKQALELGYKFRNDGERDVVKQLFGEKAFNELINQQ